MSDAQLKALIGKCESGQLKPQKGRTCEEAAYAIKTSMGWRSKKRKGK